MAGMAAPMTPEEIARSAGFPTTSPNAAMPAPPIAAQAVIPRAALAPGAAAPLKAPSAGTTELIPGQMDWIRQLIVDMIPSRSAAAAAAPPKPTGTAPPGFTGPSLLEQANNRPSGFVGPPAPQPNFFQRLYRQATTPDAPPPAAGGVRG